MNEVANYIRAKKELMDYFEFPWSGDVYNVDIQTDMYWYNTEEEVNFVDEYMMHEAALDVSDYYMNVIINKHIYISNMYTMFLVNDDNGSDDFLVIFDNSKKVGV